MRGLFCAFCFLCLSLSFNSCSTKIDVNAEYKDITVVYGILNQNDSIHYIKINKAFLGNNNAYVMAADPAMSNYDPSELEVYMEEWKNGYYVTTIPFDTTTIYNKEPGVFYYPNQYVWKAKRIINPNNPSYSDICEYKMYVLNKTNGKLISSSTKLVNKFAITQPQYSIGFNSSKTAIWKSAINGRRYEMIIRFHYKEKDALGAITDHSVDINFGYLKSPNLDGGTQMEMDYGPSFFPALSNSIPANPNVSRVCGNIDLIILAGGDELSTYIDVNAPTGSSVFDRPDYTNINNGIGVFSCRFDNMKTFAIDIPTKDSIIGGRYTKNLNFTLAF